MKININEDAIKALAEPAIKGFEQDVTEISRSHAGRPVNEVTAALVAAARGRGLEPNEEALRDVAAGISEQGA